MSRAFLKANPQVDRIAEAVERKDIRSSQTNQEISQVLALQSKQSSYFCKQRLLKRTVRPKDDASRHHQLNFGSGG